MPNPAETPLAPIARTGVILINLGTPEAPKTKQVRTYLREFLSDPRVLNMPAAARWLLLNLVILPTRPRKSAAAYAKVWTGEGSPLLVHGKTLTAGVQDQLGPQVPVELGMRYGEPSIASAVQRLVDADVDHVVALPLFPQYSAAATSSALAKLHEEMSLHWDVPRLTTLGAFCLDPGFVASWRDVAAERLERFAPDHILFSYHGLPESQILESNPREGVCLAAADCCRPHSSQNRNCYRSQCFATTDALTAALGLDPEKCSSSFQSRLGRTPWIQPFTDEIVVDLAKGGARRLCVLCPSFVADCLETIEEVGIRLDEQWREVGGESLELIPCPNDHPTWVRAVVDMLKPHL